MNILPVASAALLSASTLQHMERERTQTLTAGHFHRCIGLGSCAWYAGIHTGLSTTLFQDSIEGYDENIDIGIRGDFNIGIRGYFDIAREPQGSA